MCRSSHNSTAHLATPLLAAAVFRCFSVEILAALQYWPATIHFCIAVFAFLAPVTYSSETVSGDFFHVVAVFTFLDHPTGYGGALSVYSGFSASIQPLHASSLSFALTNNVFAHCVVEVIVESGNAYGGAVSLYVGAYASVSGLSELSVAAAGDTFVHNASVVLETTRFTSCAAVRRGRRYVDDTYGANVYGGDFSFYIGAFTWSRNLNGRSFSTCGATSASAVYVRVFDVASFASSALSTSGEGMSFGASVYGGSMSVLYVGAYAWSSGDSTVGMSMSSDVSISISNYMCSDCSAVASTTFAGNTFGGSMSVMYTGGYAWSFVEISRSTCKSTCGSSVVNGVSLFISRSSCVNCTALSTTIRSRSNGANSYGGSISALHAGAYAWSSSTVEESGSKSLCDSTIATRVSIQFDELRCLNCSAKFKSGGDFLSDSSSGANAYGGSLSAAYFGAYAYSYAYSRYSYASVEDTHVSQLDIVLSNSTFNGSTALSGESSHFEFVDADLSILF